MKRLFKILGFSLLALIVLSVLWVLLLRFVPVCGTSLMLIRKWEADAGEVVRYKWVPMDQIAPCMAQAVVASEDNLFLEHRGFDWEAIEKARQKNAQGGKLRGASTISQQTAKNVFLWPSRTWFRKGLECYFTVLIETFWSKQRIMEVYLNVVEVGPQIYGVEAASQYYFHHSAQTLSAREAARLAAVLPAPLKYRVINPGPYITKRVGVILQRMKQIGPVKWP